MSVRRPLAILLCAVALLAPTWSCLDATEIDLQIRTDEPVANIAPPQQAEIVLGTPADVLTTPTTDISSNAVDATGSFGDLVVAPNGDIHADVALRVVLGVTVPTSQCGQTPQGCIVASRTIRYVPHHELVLSVTLESKCLGVSCPASQTCVAGSCVDDKVDTDLCDGGTCGPGSLGDGSVQPDTGPADAQPEVSGCAVANPATCGANTCVDLMNDRANCGACGFDCTGGTCTQGTCQLTAAATGECLGVWNGSVYVVGQKGALFTVSTNGGAPASVDLSGAAASDVATLREAEDVAYSYFTQTLTWSADEKVHSSNPVQLPAADRIAIDDSGIAWLGLQTGQIGYMTYFAGTAQTYGQVPLTNFTDGWLAVSQGVVYASVGMKELCRATSQGSQLPCLSAGTTPALDTPLGVAVSDPNSSAPSVYVIEKGNSVVALDSKLAARSTFAGGGVSMMGLAWDKSTSTAYAISDVAISKSSGGPLTTLVDLAPAVARCIAVDASAVYWLGSNPIGVFKHFK